MIKSGRNSFSQSFSKKRPFTSYSFLHKKAVSKRGEDTWVHGFYVRKQRQTHHFYVVQVVYFRETDLKKQYISLYLK